MQPKYELIFSDMAVKQYQNLDGSVIKQVDKCLDELQYRADEVGKALRNTKNTKLAGCKEIKLKSSHIRIIYKITDQVVNILQVVYILAVGKRANDEVFDEANKEYVRMSETISKRMK